MHFIPEAQLPIFNPPLCRHIRGERSDLEVIWTQYFADGQMLAVVCVFALKISLAADVKAQPFRLHIHGKTSYPVAVSNHGLTDRVSYFGADVELGGIKQ